MADSETIKALFAEILAEKTLLSAILDEQKCTDIDLTGLLETEENFLCRNNERILMQNLMVSKAGLIRLHTCVTSTAKLIIFYNGNGAYLNTGNELIGECAYVFDVPLNPNDTLNYGLVFDDSESLTTGVKYFVLQEVR